MPNLSKDLFEADQTLFKEKTRFELLKSTNYRPKSVDQANEIGLEIESMRSGWWKLKFTRTNFLAQEIDFQVSKAGNVKITTEQTENWVIKALTKIGLVNLGRCIAGNH